MKGIRIYKRLNTGEVEHMQWLKNRWKWTRTQVVRLERWVIRKCDDHMHWSPIACHAGHHLRHNYWAKWAFWGILVAVVLMPKTSLFTVPAVIAILIEWWSG